MTVAAATIITNARALVNDGATDNLARDDLTGQVSGTNTRFRLVNRNVLVVGDGAPENPAIYDEAGTAYTGLTWSYVTGSVTFSAAPAAGKSAHAEYYFYIIAAADYDRFVTIGAKFTGAADKASVADNMEPAATYMTASAAAEKMSDKSSWWYSAAAGNKNFNKDTIAAKFREMAKEFSTKAKELRDDVHKRQGSREAPASDFANIPGMQDITPRR